MSTKLEKKISVCSLDCPDQCSLVLHIEDNHIIKVEGDKSHPVTQGQICNKVRHLGKRITSSERLTTPLKRIGPKGTQQFVPITWEEAIDMIATKWKTIIEKYGTESILPYSFYGNMGHLSSESIDRRFFYRLGSAKLERTICQAAGTTGYKYTMGSNIGTDPEDSIHAKLIILWGINAASTNMHQLSLAQQARKNGAKIITIDVFENQTAKFSDLFLKINPGTDGLLALGMMHLLFKKQLVDYSFLEKYTVGYKELEEHVKQYTPDFVAKEVGITVEQLETLAVMYGTTSPSYIRIGNGIGHHENGGMSTRAITCLPALTGQWLHIGGGCNKSNGDILLHDDNYLEMPHLDTAQQNKVINMNKIGEALLDEKLNIQSLYIYNCNLAVISPNLEKIKQGLMREDLFNVVHELFLTETTKYADLVLPAASSYEQLDFFTSYWHHYIQIQKPVLTPIGESKSNVEVFRLLAKALQFENKELFEQEEELIQRAMKNEDNPFISTLSYEELVEKEYVKAHVPKNLLPHLKTESKKIELYSKKMLEDGYLPLPTYIKNNLNMNYPFHFIATSNHNFLNSTFSNIEFHQALEKETVIFLHPTDAQALNISHMEQVLVRNENGSCELKAFVTDKTKEKVILANGLWSDSEKHLVNKLTPSTLTDLGRGSAMFTCTVEVVKIQ